MDTLPCALPSIIRRQLDAAKLQPFLQNTRRSFALLLIWLRKFCPPTIFMSRGESSYGELKAPVNHNIRIAVTVGPHCKRQSHDSSKYTCPSRVNQTMP